MVFGELRQTFLGAAKDQLQVVFTGCICCWTGCKPKQFLLGCKHETEELCIKSTCCCVVSGAAKPISCTCTPKDKGNLCKLSLYVCDCGLKVPDKCFSLESQCVCCTQAAAFPLGGPVPQCVCAVCFCRLAPGKPGFLMLSPTPPGGGQSMIGCGGAPMVDEMAR
jgi:hypothetical protein